MRVIVVGAGIGGLAVAHAAARAGAEVVVVERAPGPRREGFGLVLQPNAVQALAWLGLRDDVVARGVRVAAAEVRTPRGMLLFAVPYAQLGWETVGILRGELQNALLAAVPVDGVWFGCECVGVEQDASGVVALLGDGGRVHGDVLVGADGMRSTVRRAAIGASPPRYAGQRSWRAAARGEFGVDRFIEFWGAGGGFGFGPAGEGVVYWYCFERVAEGAPSPPDALAEFRRRYGDWPAPIAALIDASNPADVYEAFTYDYAPRRRWGNGRVTLLGDAAHAMKPNLGQGAAQALEDAAVFGACRRARSCRGIARLRAAPDQARERRRARVTSGSLDLGALESARGAGTRPGVPCAARPSPARAPAQARHLHAARAVGHRQNARLFVRPLPPPVALPAFRDALGRRCADRPRASPVERDSFPACRRARVRPWQCRQAPNHVRRR